MTFSEYIKSKTIFLCIQAMAAIFLLALFLVARLDLRLIGLFFLGWFLLLVLWIVLTYISHRRRIEKLHTQMEELSDQYLLGELLKAPKSAEEAEYYYIMKQISTSAIREVERERKEKQEYCDYVTAWVHEIKTPLTTASLILSNGGDETKLRRELKRADNMTESILYYARLRSVEKDIQVSKLSLENLLNEAVVSEMELLIAAGISAQIHGNAEVYTDAKLLIFVVKQFLINSAKYCKGCQIDFNIRENELTITDNGPGIPPEEITRVMERGFTGKAYRESKGSTGMGLYIAHQLCEQMNVKMEIASEVGHFTRITLTFPNLTNL